MKRTAFLVWICLGLVLPLSVVAEKLVLKDGRELDGKVFVNGRTATVISGGKVFQMNVSEIKSRNSDSGKPATTVKEPAKTATGKNPVILIKTSMGDITAELFEDKVPNTVANMIALAESGFYKGMRFHRIISGFMAQGGCPNSKKGATGMPGTGDPGYRFADEFAPELKHDGPGVLSMANSGPGTNGSQFFLCFKATPWLDGKHAVFGKVTKGFDILKKLEAVGSRSGKTSEDVEYDIQVLSKQDHPYTVKKL